MRFQGALINFRCPIAEDRKKALDLRSSIDKVSFFFPGLILSCTSKSSLGISVSKSPGGIRKKICKAFFAFNFIFNLYNVYA